MTKRGTKAPDRWIDMTKFDSIAAAHEETSERALDAIDGALGMLSYFATADGRAAVESHVRAYAHWKMDTRAKVDTGSMPVAHTIGDPAAYEAGAYDLEHDTGALPVSAYNLDEPPVMVGDPHGTTVMTSPIGYTPQELTAILSREEAQRGDVIGAMTNAQVDKWLAMMDRMIGRGTAFYVSPRMVRIATDIAHELDTVPLFPTDLPVSAGYLWLGMPIMCREYGFDDYEHVVDMDVPIRVLAWDETEVMRPLEGQRVRNAAGPLVGDETPGEHGTGIAVLGLCAGDEVRRAVEAYEARKGIPSRKPWPNAMRWVPWETTGWGYGMEWRQATDDEDAGNETLPAGVVNVANTFLRKFMFACWQLIRQEVAVVEPFRPDRHAQRRIARQQPNFGDLLIVRLRRIYDPLVELTDEERGERAAAERQWSHRWRVNEHWAWRACGPGRTERRLVKIESYVKGPEHLPLIEKDKVYSLER